MKKAFLITAHKNPAQLARLCQALEHPDFDIYINIDKKANISDYQKVIKNVYFITNRINIIWGHITQVESTLNGLREIIAQNKDYSHIFFISGQDYPIMPLSYISDFLDKNPEKIFISYSNIDTNSKYDRKMRKRYEKYYFFFSRRKLIRYSNVIFWILPNRKPYHKIYKGASWWTITSNCAQYILNKVNNDKVLVNFYKRTYCPDEMFFQSIIMDSEFKQHIVNEDYRYVVFPGPKILNTDDFNSIIHSGKWFARKFEPNIDNNILNMLDKHIKSIDI